MMKKQIGIFGKMFGYTVVVRRRRVRRRRAKRTAKSSKNYLQHKEIARALVLERLEHFKKFYAECGYDFKFGRVSIRNQRTRWGSCSRHGDRPGNLNFNYHVALLPPALCDYVVVHELCHLGQFNHSRKFWDLVALACSDYREIRAELKRKKLRLG